MAYDALFERFRTSDSSGGLHEGVPEWMSAGLMAWLSEQIANARDVRGRLHHIEQILRTALDWSSGEHSAWRDLSSRMDQDDELALEVANLMLRYLGPKRGFDPSPAAVELAMTLYRSGSAWEVQEDDDRYYQLRRRVPADVQTRYTDVSNEGRAGKHLRKAWALLYGREPNPSEAYRHAVSAVEAAGAPIISPANSRTTLGTMIADFKAKPEKWLVPLGATADEGRQVLLAMMEGVWRGQSDRHGTPDEDRPMSVAKPEAEAALHTALTVVHLFRQGLISFVG